MNQVTLTLNFDDPKLPLVLAVLGIAGATDDVDYTSAMADNLKKHAEETTPPPPPPGDDVDLDANGLPWDERIHARTKTKNGDGTWKKRRGVDPAVVLTVEAELKGASREPGAPPPPTKEKSEITEFGALLAAANAAGIDEAEMTEVCAQFELPNMMALASRPDLVNDVATELEL